jgi:glycyl-tRNA synthetase beta chain
MSKKSAAPKTADFLLDIHTEPFPARFVPPALEQLERFAAEQLAPLIGFKTAKASGTLRHLILRVEGLESKSKDTVEKNKGPKTQAPAPAVEGFARKYGLAPADLKVEDGVYYAVVEKKGLPAAELLAKLVPEWLKAMQFPKTMVWEETRFSFGRPIRGITALLGEKVVPFTVAGVKSGRAAYGHPVLGKAPAQLKDPSKHAAALRQGLVIADPAERKAYLSKQLDIATKKTGGASDPDPELLEETAFMVEHPVPVLGALRDEHMALPHALLKLVMKKQLKYFPVLAKDGSLLPFFVGVRDGLSTGNELVREGYQRVMEARFNDAAFFTGRDGASTLASKLPQLERVTYQKALGSMAQKAARVEQLAAALCAALRDVAPVDEGVVREAATLAYADLVTDVVKEFPELQGSMGGVYARKDGLSEKVALAVEQFYFPVAAKTPAPATPEAAVVSLAGKLDSLAGCFAAGLIPTGSADPYALRRQALGVVRILLEKQLPLDLDAALAKAVSLQPVAVPDAAKLQAQLAEFIWGRAASLFEESGFAVDEVRAVRADALKNLVASFQRLAALRAVRRDPSFEPLAAAFKRASNILKTAKGVEDVPEKTLLKEPAELALYDALVSAEGSANDRIVRGDFEGGLKSLVTVKPHLDLFFDKVMVMVEDESLKRQRLALLGKLVRAFKRVADLSEIQAGSAS